MSIMSELADEALKPVKKGVFVAAAALTIGGLAIAANSKTGRKIGKGISNAVQGKTPEEILAEKEKAEKAKLAEQKQQDAKSAAIEHQPDEEPKKPINKGAQNA